MADILRAHELSLLQTTRLAADRRLNLPVTSTGTSGRGEKSKDRNTEIQKRSESRQSPVGVPWLMFGVTSVVSETFQIHFS